MNDSKKPRLRNPLGMVFGRLTVVSRAGTVQFKTDRKATWLCHCECGNETVVYTSSLTGGNTVSCGCFKRDNAHIWRYKHGSYKNPEYRNWSLMKDRCINPNNKKFADYGGRGITVCKRWAGSFSAFLGDMGRRPFQRAEIERIDNDGNYEPSNCRWATRKEQMRNTRANHLVTYQGRTQCVAAWAEETGIDARTLWKRLRRRCPLDRVFARRRLHRFR